MIDHLAKGEGADGAFGLALIKFHLLKKMGDRADEKEMREGLRRTVLELHSHQPSSPWWITPSLTIKNSTSKGHW